MRRSQKRIHLLNVATRLFNQYGYHAVGIDTIVEQAQIAKTTLYRHYKSKDMLIIAVLRNTSDDYTNNLRNYVSEIDSKPLENIMRVFDFLDQWINSEDYNGCIFVGAASEFNDQNSQILDEVLRHKQVELKIFEELVARENIANPKEAAYTINLLHEGAIAVAHATNDKDAAKKAKIACRRILDDKNQII